MLKLSQKEALVVLAKTIERLRPLIDVFDEPVRAVVSEKNWQNVAGNVRLAAWAVEAVCGRLAVPVIEIDGAEDKEDLDIFASMVGQFLGPQLHHLSEECLPLLAEDVLDVVLGGVNLNSFKSDFPESRITLDDGSFLKTYASCSGAGRVVLISSACGMPARLCEEWMRVLNINHDVITWETRGMFPDCDNFDERQCAVADQAADLLRVLDHYQVERAHLMGVCGGAVVALAAAACDDDCIDSLSLWHGDYELGDSVSRTAHQQDLIPLMQFAAESPDSAKNLRQVFRTSVSCDVPGEMANILLYPYANDRLLYRYGRLNGAIMTTDMRPYLSQVKQKAVVVTSEDDTTTHPDGSRYVAEHLSGAELSLLNHGDHLSFFKTPQGCRTILSNFLGQAT